MAEHANPENTPTIKIQPDEPKDPHFTPKLNAALAKAQAAFKQPKKTATLRVHNKEGKFLYETKYAPLEEIISSIGQALATNGIRFSQYPVAGERGSRLVLKVAHESGEYELTYMPIDLSGGPQQIGGQLTYMKRYQLGAYFGVAADEDDDGNAAQNEGKIADSGSNNASIPAAASKPATASKPKADPKPKAGPVSKPASAPAPPKEAEPSNVTPIKKGSDPGAYVFPEGFRNLTGQTVQGQNENSLRAVLGAIAVDKKKMPPPKNLGDLIETERQIKAFFDSVGVKL